MNIVYNASAGTGKTYQVTQRYQNLVLEQGIDPRRILLMTFTENAAAELRTNVVHRLLKIRREDGETADRAAEALRHLPAAPIGTIHGFCTRLLREHALEAGLPPAFTTLEEDERTELLRRICRDELIAQLAHDPDFRTFCAGTYISTSNDTGLIDLVPTLLDQAGSLGVDLTRAESLLDAPLPPITIDAFADLRDQLAALAKRSPKVEEAMKTLSALLAQTQDPQELADRFDASFRGHFSFGEAKAIYSEFKALKEQMRTRAAYRAHYPAARAFARYVQTVAQRYAHQKHAMSAVDFNDQLLLAETLLESRQARTDFEYVIVDEVQDTSRIQYRIIRSLWGPTTRLIICGDRKQSIYAWRGADPHVMPDLEHEIRQRPHEVLNLQISRRSKAPLLEVFNRLFSAVYGAEAYGPTDRLEPNPEHPAPRDEPPCVEFLVPDPDLASASKQDRVNAEMTALAQRIQLLVQGGASWRPATRYDGDTFAPVSERNAYRYGDILVLLRSTTHQPALEHALRHAGIRYTLGGKGRGLFARQETRDVSLFLSVITNPDDHLALVGFLRSPWIGLSDEAIAELAWDGTRFSNTTLTTAVHPALERIAHYRTLVGTHSASELVRLIIAETGYDAILAGLPRGPQRLANLRKILDWLRDAERGARTPTAAVARHLANLVAAPPKVPEAALLDPAQDAVTIMTVHASKGLTKRVVFLPDTGRRDRNPGCPALLRLDESGHPHLEIKTALPDRSAVTSPGHATAMAHEKAVRTHESLNLFYVAMTRARDLVVVSAAASKQCAGWQAALEPLLGNGIAAIDHATLAAASPPPAPLSVRRPTEHELASAIAALPPPLPEPRLRRLAATQLAREEEERSVPVDPAAPHGLRNAAALGSLGHAVLEQLAHHAWHDATAHWLDALAPDFRIAPKQAAQLQDRIDRTRLTMAKQTARAEILRPEFPFVLQRDELLIDGSIDLLCRLDDEVHLFDYKFTEADDPHVLAAYREQLAIYRAAAARAFPDAPPPRATLVIIGAATTRLCPVP